MRLSMESNKQQIIFVDTSFFKALVDLKDDFHQEAKAIWMKIEKEKCELITTNYILDESFTLIRIRCGVETVSEFRRRLLGGLASLKIVRVMIVDEIGAWEWFENDWKDLSFTDCVSFAIMNRLKLERVATFDKHFIKAGFQIEM